MMAEEGTSNVAKEGIRMYNLDEDDEPKCKIKNHSNGASLQDPSVSRQYSLKRVMKTLSPSKQHDATRLTDACDVENGGSQEHP